MLYEITNADTGIHLDTQEADTPEAAISAMLARASDLPNSVELIDGARYAVTIWPSQEDRDSGGLGDACTLTCVLSAIQPPPPPLPAPIDLANIDSRAKAIGTTI